MPQTNKELSNGTIGLMVGVALFYDVVQILFSWIGLGWLIIPVAYGTFWLWFKMRGVNFFSSKRVTSFGVGIFLETVSAGIIPSITFNVLRCALDYKVKKAIPGLTPTGTSLTRMDRLNVRLEKASKVTGQILEAGGGRAAGATVKSTGRAVQYGGKALSLTGKGAEIGGRVMEGAGRSVAATGTRLAQRGAMLSRTGVGALAGVPMAAVGGAAVVAGKTAEISGKATTMAGKLTGAVGTATEKAGGTTAQAGKHVEGAIRSVGKNLQDPGDTLGFKKEQLAHKLYEEEEEKSRQRGEHMPQSIEESVESADRRKKVMDDIQRIRERPAN